MKDDWVKAALSDDSVVVDLLLRLKQPSLLEFCKPPPSSSLFLPQGWGKHQPRSRFAVCANTIKKHSGGNSSITRRSPTTPLSWSGGGGGGGGAAGSHSDGYFDGHSDSDRAFSDLSRSKDEYINISSISKSFGKRKALCELEDDNNLPCPLSKKLKLISTPEAHLQQQRVRSLTSKTTKFDTVIQRLEKETIETSSASAITVQIKAEKIEEEQQQQKRIFILPDLNTMPAPEPEGDDI